MSLKHLVERVEVSEGRDYGLDFEVLTYLGLDTAHYVHKWPLTTSVDAVLALMARKLPRWEFTLAAEYPDAGGQQWHAEVGAMSWDGEASSPARALLAATLRALIAQANASPTPAQATGNGLPLPAPDAGAEPGRDQK